MHISWIPEFVTSKIVTLDDAEGIRNDSCNNAKSKMLNYISGPLQAGKAAPFYHMLSIMQTKEAAAKELADEILAELATTSEKTSPIGNGYTDTMHTVQNSCNESFDEFKI